MTNELAITILKEMQEEIKATGNLTKDFEALDIAIKALEGTALEVPVQEQLTKEKADLLLQEQFKIFAEYNQTSPSLQNINAMINIYTTLFPNQFFQE